METDWKKKYEEALEKARELNGTLAAGRDFFAEIFPELAESEDERIRKHIVTFIMEANRRGEAPEECTKWLAYLEKQKAKERLDRMAPIYNDKESFESALEKAWKYYNESASRTVDSFEDDYIECVFSKGFREGFLYREKKKEQMPISKTEPIVDGLTTEFEKQVSYLIASVMDKEHEYSEGYVKWVSQSLLGHAKFAMSQQEKQKEQKPADLPPGFYFIDSDGHKYYSKEFRFGNRKMKIVEDKSEKPAEWSEEDRLHYANVLEALEYVKGCKSDYDKIEAVKSDIAWLKSFRPQPHTVSIKDATKFGNLEYERGVKDGIQHVKNHQWKPSEEQMRQLGYVAEQNKRNMLGQGLMTLYEDLKKLM